MSRSQLNCKGGNNWTSYRRSSVRWDNGHDRGHDRDGDDDHDHHHNRDRDRDHD